LDQNDLIKFSLESIAKRDREREGGEKGREREREREREKPVGSPSRSTLAFELYVTKLCTSITFHECLQAVKASLTKRAAI
jgi:hypothetical protein